MNRPNIARAARANVSGSAAYPDIHGTVIFRQTPRGVLVSADITGLPHSEDNCEGSFFGFHIHNGGSCTGSADDSFANTLGHYDPHGCTHPYHAGDLPPLLGASGHAISVCLSDRFTISDIIGKTIVIHSGPDDFTTQPAGNSGAKIGCGEIRTLK